MAKRFKDIKFTKYKEEFIQELNQMPIPDIEYEDGTTYTGPRLMLFHMVKDLLEKYNELVSLIDPNPSNSSHLKADLQGWCDVRGISYDTKTTKSQLLEKVNTWNS